MKLWKRILLKVPKVGIAYRAFRLHKKAKLAYRLRKLLKLIEEDPRIMLQALKSKTVWAGIVHELYALWELWAGGGVIDGDVILPALSGIVMIVLRAVTTKPLSEK